METVIDWAIIGWFGFLIGRGGLRHIVRYTSRKVTRLERDLEAWRDR